MEEKPSIDQVVEKLDSYCEANQTQSFFLGACNSLKKPQASCGRALANIWKFINVMLIIFPSGHLDPGLLKKALHTVIVKLENRPEKAVKLNNTKTRPTHEFVDWVVKRTVVVMYHFRRLANTKRLETCMKKCSSDDQEILSNLLLNLKAVDDDSPSKDSQGLFSSDEDDNSESESVLDFAIAASAGLPAAASVGPPAAASAGPPAAASAGPRAAAELPWPAAQQPCQPHSSLC